ALAQDAFAPRHDGDVDDLQQAPEMGAVADRADGNIVQELLPRLGSQGKDRGMEGMGDETRSAQFQGVRYRRVEAGRSEIRKHFAEAPAASGGGGDAAGAGHPRVPADDPPIAIEQDEPSIERVEDAAAG